MAAIYEGLRDLLYNPRNSDLDIICQNGARFKVHRVVITLNSPILDSLVTESVNDNGQLVRKIELPNVEYSTVFMMLQFLYGGNYNDYETVGSFHTPSYVAYMNAEEIEASLSTLPCLQTDLANRSTGLYEHDDGQESDDPDSEEYEEDLDDKSSSDGGAGDESSKDRELDEHKEDEDVDNRRVRTFQGHNLFDSLSVYCLALWFDIPPLKLLARDRFYRTAEKVLMYRTNVGNDEEAKWWTHDHQRIYQSKLVKAVFDDFPQAVRALYGTVPTFDTTMRAIPPILIAAGYNNDEFRNHVKPLLEEYPDLALAVVECMRVPNSEE
ncbi:hypothetical protein F5Y03DRAFT_396014 [Xylaria venustula]|nr:hypothetical protein F5Y03DRAFT_396014 [Xylaria venustula]